MSSCRIKSSYNIPILIQEAEKDARTQLLESAGDDPDFGELIEAEQASTVRDFKASDEYSSTMADATLPYFEYGMEYIRLVKVQF